MSVHIEADGDAAYLRIVYSDTILLTDIDQALDELAAHLSGSNRPVLVDWSEGALSITHAEFMGRLDDWFDRLGSGLQVAMVFNAISQRDQSMLTDTKNFLKGGGVRTFTDRDTAEKWLTA